MGFFNSIFNKIGHGLSSIGHTVGHGLTSIVKPIYSHVISPVYKSVIKPAYTKLISPVVGAVGRISGKALSTGEQIVNNGLDFSQRFQKQGQGIALNAESGVGSLVKMLSNPAVMVIGGIAGLIIVSKI
jgi:hypothetical protein